MNKFSKQKLNKRNMTTNKRNQDRTGQLSTHNIFLSNSCRSDAVYPKNKLVWLAKIALGSSKLNCSRQYVIISILLYDAKQFH